MASTTSDTGDTSSKQQQAQRKEKYNKSKRPFRQSCVCVWGGGGGQVSVTSNGCVNV